MSYDPRSPEEQRSTSIASTTGGSSSFQDWLDQQGRNDEEDSDFTGGSKNVLFPSSSSVHKQIRYHQSDLDALMTLPADMLSALQQGLAAAGFLNGDFQLGVWNEKTKNAYQNLLEFANANGITWQEALQIAINNTGQFGDDGSFSGGAGSGATLPPLQIQLPNPEDVYNTFEQASLSMTDRADSNVIGRLRDQYMDYLRDIQEQDYQEQISGAARQEFTDPMSLESFAQANLNKRDIAAADTRDAMEILLSSVGQFQPSQREF